LATEHVERRLVAILAADVAGYSRLMGADEEGTLAQLKAIRKALVDPTIATHRGRIVKTTGDGMLVEFASAVDAARGAAEVQRAMAKQNANVPQHQRIEFRIGIHVGDIMFDDSDIFGDGVNIAARLEGIAEPGGICVSDDAHRQIRGKIDLTFDDMGPQSLKNIAEPMRAWRLQIDKSSASTAPRKASVEAAQPLALPDKPSIAVLPFQNMSGDAEQEYFADGMVEEIITALSRVKRFFVIARNSSFTYKGKHVDIRQVGRELGVRYVLEGSIRKSSNRVRITGQLIEAETGNHVWADKFEGELKDVFELQDRITETVVAAIEPSLERAEINRASFKPTNSLDAYDLCLRAHALHHSQSQKGYKEALLLLDRAIILDPNYALAKAFASEIIGVRVYLQRQHKVQRETADETARGGRLALEALHSSGDEPTTIAYAAYALGLAKDYDTAVAAMDRAIHLNPNSTEILRRSGWLRIWTADADRAIDEFSRALRLSPLDPAIGNHLNGLAHGFLLNNQPDKALDYARRSTHEMPHWYSTWMALVVALVNVGNEQEAQEAARRLMEVSPNFSITKRWNLFRDKWPFDLLSEGLRKAGLPE
jgi:adenylate cyclase